MVGVLEGHVQEEGFVFSCSSDVRDIQNHTSALHTHTQHAWLVSTSALTSLSLDEGGGCGNVCVCESKEVGRLLDDVSVLK